MNDETSTRKHPSRVLRGRLALCARRTVSRGRLAVPGVATLAASLALAGEAVAADRGSIGGALDVGHGELGFVGNSRAGLSAWYRLEPALSLGVSASRLYVDNGDAGGETVIDSATLVEGFADGRLFPASFIGGFGRASAGVAQLTVSRYSGDTHRLRPALELELGPELRIFFEPQQAPSRSALFLRLRGTFSVIPRDSDVERAASAFFGYGLALGFEG